MASTRIYNVTASEHAHRARSLYANASLFERIAQNSIGVDCARATRRADQCRDAAEHHAALATAIGAASREHASYSGA